MSLYGWGSNSHNQIPIPEGSSSTPSHHGTKGLDALGGGRTSVPAIFFPTALLLDDRHDDVEFVSVAAGEAHSLMLTSSGDVLSFGKGPALGRDPATLPEPVVRSLSHETVVAVAAGSLTSFAITAAGKVYQWGLIHDKERRAEENEEEDEDEEGEGKEEANDDDPSSIVAAATAGALVGLAQVSTSMPRCPHLIPIYAPKLLPVP